MLFAKIVPAKPGDQRREAQTRVHAVEIHVADAGLDVVTAAPHLVEARRLHAPLFFGPTGDRVEPDLRVQVVFVDPGFAAVLEGDDLGRVLGEVAGMRPSKRSAGSMR